MRLDGLGETKLCVCTVSYVWIPVTYDRWMCPNLMLMCPNLTLMSNNGRLTKELKQKLDRLNEEKKNFEELDALLKVRLSRNRSVSCPCCHALTPLSVLI